MYNNIRTEQIKERLESFITGDRLRIAIVDTDNGIMLKVSLVDWGGWEVAFFTDSRYLAVHRKICGNEVAKLRVELGAYFGSESDLSFKYTKGIFETYAVFDVSKVWEELKYTPTREMNLSQFRAYLAESEAD